ncbi:MULTISPECIES: L,D-transpeptidase family protein [Marinitoga]|uniref:L,D-transpeptidase family protein n=1 Tax=Marinitoga TaxID=160798 RepID=UPI00067FE3A0|nr:MULTISPECIES: L,D-transpeptidase family protein [Marinitoga]
MLKKTPKRILLLILLIIFQSLLIANTLSIDDFHDNIIFLKFITKEKMINPHVSVYSGGFRVIPEYSTTPSYIGIKININDFSKNDILTFNIEFDSLNGHKTLTFHNFIKLKYFSTPLNAEISTIETPDGWKGVLVNNSNNEFKITGIKIDNKIELLNTENNIFYLPQNLDNGFHTLDITYENTYKISFSKKIKFFKKDWFFGSSNLKGASYRVEFISNYLVKKGDSIYKIARKFGVKPGEIVLYNNIKDPKKIYSGQLLKIGKLRFGESPLVITVDLDKSILNLYYLGEKVLTFPAAVGRSDATPPGYYRIMYKEKEPALYWYGEYIKPGSIINGIGSRWLQLSEEQYGIHGTTKPWEIGKRISHGCIRLFNQDVELLDFLTGIGTEVYAIKSVR